MSIEETELAYVLLCPILAPRETPPASPDTGRAPDLPAIPYNVAMRKLAPLTASTW